MNINKTYVLPFPLEKVYANWVSSNTVIAPATSMDILPEVGGHYRLTMDTPEYKSVNAGTFLIVEPNARVRYTWEWNYDGEMSEIDVTFAASEKGTTVVIEQSGFKTQHSADMHDQGWDNYIKGFKMYLSQLD